MSRRPAGLLIEDMLERIHRIERFVEGLEHDAFLRHELVADAVVRNLEVIGEAANRLPLEFRNRHASIEWKLIIGLRNRIVHEYFDVDLDLAWTIVKVELPPLKARLHALRGEPDVVAEFPIA